ncbi:MAG: hypothetical protein DMF95_22025 [Acidobacteria bacterium]|nr:MAG: hypothetical protein DMF96_08440 [Acidobacteriota bacterium]PYR18595.1 MAG: hypothetical protein DMF94_19475 [Acidobacteriota bacterium]PYR44911.1 MAG: hypothetical protein DMF95_22025 [Acidobacteriota bacterium]
MTSLTNTADAAIPELAGHQRRLLIAGGVGAAVSLAGLFFDVRQFLQSYLMAYMLCLGVTLGCLALGMVHQLSGGAWGVVIRRPIGAAARVLPVMTLLFLPIAFGMNRLYGWTNADLVAHDEALQHKHLYLNTPFFLVRAAVYFLVWNGLSYFLNAWSLEQDRTAEPRLARRMQRLSGGGLLAYGLTITFASFDWLMSLEPHWFSTIYGVLIVGGQGLSALAFLTAALVWLSRRPPLNRIVVPAHFHDLGNLMLAFVMLWAYFSFSQYLIIWSGNLPVEISWYLHRLQTGWRAVGLTLILFHFSAPFVVLLSRRAKREPDLLVKVAIGILIVRLIDLFWLIAPEFHQNGIFVSWLDVVLPLTLGSIWLACFIRQLRGRPLLPVHDPEFESALGRIIERGAPPRTAH